MGKHYDISGLESMAAGNQDFIKKMINMFIDMAPGQLNTMQKALADEDYELFGRTAHSMKPSIDMLCIEEMRKEVRELENKGKEKQEVESLPDLFSTFKQKVELTTEDLGKSF